MLLFAFCCWLLFYWIVCVTEVWCLGVFFVWGVDVAGLILVIVWVVICRFGLGWIICYLVCGFRCVNWLGCLLRAYLFVVYCIVVFMVAWVGFVGLILFLALGLVCVVFWGFCRLI